MSDAQEPDLIQYLAVRRSELETALHDSRNRVLAEASGRGTVGSGATLKLGVGGLEQTFSQYIDEMASVVDRWSGDRLPASRVREIITDHLKRSVEALATADVACGAHGRGIKGSTLDMLNGIVSQAKRRIFARVREFELGANRAETFAPGTLVQIVHAENIIGGVVQAGGDASQANTVQLSAETIAASLEHLIALVTATAPDIIPKIEHDAATIRAQLSKDTPSPTIVQESGRTIRNVVEGAVGGALGNAMSPAVLQALAAFSAALGG